MTAYNWTIATLEHNVADGGVIVAHWRVSAEDGEHTASAYGAASFTPDPESPSFTPYEKLTEADVLNWVWGAVDKAKIESMLAKQIEVQKSPPVISGLPWAEQV
jgi:hypothetical protein